MGTNNESNNLWDDASKSALVAQIVSGKLSVKAACQRHGLSADTIQQWVRIFRRTTLQALDDHLRQTFLGQGADATSLGSAEYTGTLADIPIPDLIQTFQMAGKDGVITVTSADGQRSQIWCLKGEIVDAESGRLRGEAALYHILDFERGNVFADFRSEARARTIELPGHVLLLEAARRRDECARLVEKLGGRRSIYRASASALERASAAERHVLSFCDGQRTVADLVAHSEIGDLETLTVLAQLSERGELSHQGTSIVPDPPASASIVSGEPSSVTFLPLATSQGPTQSRARRSALIVAGLSMALGAAGWALANSEAWPWRAPPPPRTEVAKALEPEPPAPELFTVDSIAEPAEAQFWLDGAQVGVGRLQRELPRDGQAHALRVTAKGHAPMTLLFVDSPPPSHITLEKLAEPPPPPPSVVSEPPAPPPRPPPRTRSSSPPRRAERHSPAPEAAAAKAADPKTSVPRVQIIESTAPVVRVIE